MVGGVVLYLICSHFPVPLNYLTSIYVFAAATVLGEIIPIAPGGVGATEGGMTGILVVLGMALGDGLVVVLLFRAATLVFGILLGLLFFLLFYSQRAYIKARQYV